jgi:putative transposase
MDHADIIAAARRQRLFRARSKLTQAGFFSHITQRAAGKEPLFVEDSDRLAFLSIFKETALAFDVEVQAFCLMTNHVHILLRPREQNLEKAMHSLFSRYAVHFNRKYQRRGHLFGGAYRQAVCLDATYLLAASAYIHLNPVKAGLSTTPEEYRWSSCSLYLEDSHRKSFVDPSPVLSLFRQSGKDARASYARLLCHGTQTELDNAMESGGAIERLCSKLKALCPDILALLQGPRDKKESPDPKLTEIVDLETQIESMRAVRRMLNPHTRQARKHLVEQLVSRGFTHNDIAERLAISRKTVHNILFS